MENHSENDNGIGPHVDFVFDIFTPSRYIFYTFALTHLCPILTLRYSFTLQTMNQTFLTLFLAKQQR